MKKLFALFASLAVALTAFAAAEKYADITQADLKAAIADGKVTLLDANGPDSYAEGHLPGAVDYAVIKDKLADKLPADKSALVVAYCGGPQCTAYRKAYDAAVALGYTNVKHFTGGLSGWTGSGEKLVK